MWFHITLTFYGERKKNRSGTENTTSTRSHTYIVQMLMYRDTAKKQNNNNIKKKDEKVLGIEECWCAYETVGVIQSCIIVLSKRIDSIF